MSRLREKPEKLFEVFLEVGKSVDEKEDPFIITKYPDDYNDVEVIKSAPKFAFPCITERTTVDHFTFTLTDLDSKFKFGFVRHATGAQTCFCIISFLPWFEVFYNFLNVIAEIRLKSDNDDITKILHSAYVQEVPGPNVPVTIVAEQEMFSFKSPDMNKLQCIPSSRNLTEYYNAVDTENMMIIFASMLHERRIIVHSKKLSRLTAVVHAAVSLLSPMFWQHLFIPVLPSFLIDYLSAPMPFVIGVHSSMKPKSSNELGDAVIVDADNNEVMTQYDDLHNLPDEISSYLKRHLKGDKIKNSMQGSSDIISRTFMLALVRLIGGYRDALKFNEGDLITFSPEAFVQSRPISMQPFLENMLHLQIFQQFINDRLDMLNDGHGFEDIFEQECLLHADKLNSQTRYDEWLKKMKNQSRKLHRGGKDIWADFKVKASPVVKDAKGFMDHFAQRAGPAMTSAVESVKIQSKKAYTKARTKINEMKKDDTDSTKIGKSKVKSTPVPKDRPSTVGGAPSVPQRSSVSPNLDNVHHRKPGREASDEKNGQYLSTVDGTNHKSTDDGDLMLYKQVSCNLIEDLDIQNVLFKSASAENILKGDPSLKHAGSSETITSNSSMEADLDDRRTLAGAGDSYMSYKPLPEDSDSGIVMRSYSQNSLDKSKCDNVGKSKVDVTPTLDCTSSTNQLPVRPPITYPRKSVSPNVPNVSDRLIDTKSPRGRPHPAPRKSTEMKLLSANTKLSSAATKSPHAGGDVLIDFTTTTSEVKTPFDLALQFDKMTSSGDNLLSTEPKLVNIDDNSFSIHRTPAVKPSQQVTHTRPIPSFTTNECSQTLLDFDPLQENSWDQSSKETESPSVHVQMQCGNNDSLMKEWDIQNLTTKHVAPSPAIWPAVYPSTLSPCTPVMYTSASKPPDNSDIYNLVGFPNPVTSAVPTAPPRRKNRLNFSPGHGGQLSNLQTLTNNKNVSQSDPFAELVNLNQSSSKKASPLPEKKWETFN